MRTVILAILIAILALNGVSSVALADGMILPQTLNSQYLVVRYHHVTVTIEDNHVVTRVEQEFYNPQSFTVNGRYLFPVPPEAILSTRVRPAGDTASTESSLLPALTANNHW